MTVIERDEAQALAMEWLAGAREGRYAVISSDGVRRPEGAQGTLAVFWWTRHPALNPVFIVFSDEERTYSYAEMPDELGRAWLRRFERDVRKFERECERGVAGKTLSAFRLGTFAEFVDLVEGSLAQYGAVH